MNSKNKAERGKKMKYDKIKIAHEIARAVGGTPKVINYINQKDQDIDIFIGEDRPDEYIRTCATIGLSEYTIFKRIDGKPLRAEMIGAADSELEYFPNIVSDCAFNIIRGEYSVGPGNVYPDMIAPYYPNASVRHIFFTKPFLWNLQPFDFDEAFVNWLQLIPITEGEYQYLRKFGPDKLEDLFEEHQIDVYDFMRPSVVC